MPEKRLYAERRGAFEPVRLYVGIGRGERGRHFHRPACRRSAPASWHQGAPRDRSVDGMALGAVLAIRRVPVAGGPCVASTSRRGGSIYLPGALRSTLACDNSRAV